VAQQQLHLQRRRWCLQGLLLLLRQHRLLGQQGLLLLLRQHRLLGQHGLLLRQHRPLLSQPLARRPPLQLQHQQQHLLLLSTPATSSSSQCHRSCWTACP
jgi:hypothetical protein